MKGIFMSTLSKLIIKVSPVKATPQRKWHQTSQRCIKRGTIEPLSDAGLLQAIDNLAYEIALDGMWCATSDLSDEECDLMLDSKTKQMDNIVHVVALAAGIHPTSIDYVVGIRSDYYVNILVNNINKVA